MLTSINPSMLSLGLSSCANVRQKADVALQVVLLLFLPCF